MILTPETHERARTCALFDRAPVYVRMGASPPEPATLGDLLRADDELWSDRETLFAALWRGDVYTCGGGAAPRVAIIRRT